MSITRRRFVLGAASLAVAGSALERGALFAAEVPAGGSMAREPLRELPYSAVKITGGPFKQHFDFVHTHYLALDNDRLLKVYRQRAGLPAPGRDMGGWYDTEGFVPGHTLGQYISGLARIGAATGDSACHEKVHDLVAGFAATMARDDQTILRPKTNLWTCYTLDKHIAGLLDASRLSGNSQAKALLPRVLSGSQALLPEKGRDRIGKKDPPYDETFVMPENLFAAHALTGDPAFRQLAVRYLLDKEYFDPLARNENVFPNQHAYSHAIALSSGAKAYEVLGDAKYKIALENAWTRLTTEQQFSSGGWGPNETFITPHRGELHASLTSTVDHFETPCGAYAATKLDRYLMRFTGDAKYGDNLERVLWNTILSTRLPDSDGDYPYYSTYSTPGSKVFYPKKWPCCSGTLVQTVADYVLNLYFQSDDGLYVNLYVPSEVSWQQGDASVKLTQTTEMPALDTAAFRVQISKPKDFTLNLRIPAWINGAAEIRVNGETTAIAGMTKGFLPLRRRWKTGDRIDVTFPQVFRTEQIDDLHPETVALMRGPLLYVALNPVVEGKKRMTLPDDLKPLSPGSGSFRASRQPGVLVPFYGVANEAYSTYFERA